MLSLSKNVVRLKKAYFEMENMEIYHQFLPYFSFFGQQLRDHLQTEGVLDERMFDKIKEILREILSACTNQAPVVDSDQYESSSNSSDSGASSSSSSHEVPQYENYQNTRTFRVNFAFHLERILNQKLRLFTPEMIGSFSKRLADAAELNDAVLGEVRLLPIKIYMNARPLR